MGLDEQSRLHWKFQCVNTVKAVLADRGGEIWNGDAKYAYARGTFAADVTKKKLLRWLCLAPRHFLINPPWFLNRKFAEANSKAAFTRMDQTWVEDMASQLLAHMQKVVEYTERCYYWHQNRIMAELERTKKLDAADLCNTCHLCNGILGFRGLGGFLVHMQASHEEFWGDGTWMIV